MWQVYLVNFLVWTGISASGIVFAAILNVTNAKWARPIKRISEGLGFFLPVSFVLFLVLYFGRNVLFPWIEHPVHGKEAWLNFPFMFMRNGIGLLIFCGLSFLFLYRSIRPDIGSLVEKKAIEIKSRLNFIIEKWEDTENEVKKSEDNKGALSAVLLILYCLIFSLVGMDLVMSLDPHWYSTLFGAYFFIGNLYAGFAFIALVSIVIRKYYKLSDIVTPKIFHDLGKLIFAFCILTADFFYSQFLVIWYGNLPEETRYIIQRAHESPWQNLSWAVLILCFVIPFFVLLFRKAKLNPKMFFIISIIIIAGIWLERFMLIVPSVWNQGGFPFGIIEIAMTAGFAGLFLAVIAYGYSLFPIVPVTDPLLESNLKLKIN